MTVPHMPMMNDDGLLECAHCTSMNVSIECDDEGWSFIECHDCMIRTDGYRNGHSMRAAWNTRAGHLYTPEDFKQAGQERDYGF